MNRSRHGRAAATALMAVLASAGVARGQMTAPVQMTAPAKASAPKLAPVLSERDVDPFRLLPPPPAEGSGVEKAEIAELHAIQDIRTPDELKHALHNDEHEDASVFASVLGPDYDLSKLPATAKLMAQVRADDSAASKRAKAAFLRLRPYALDPTIVGCPYKAADKPRTSYPSGHATMVFAAATVLSDLAPNRAQDMMRYATGYAHDRLVCGHHYQSDVVAGQVLGTVVGEELLHSPALKGDIDAARAELLAARIAAQ